MTNITTGLSAILLGATVLTSTTTVANAGGVYSYTPKTVDEIVLKSVGPAPVAPVITHNILHTPELLSNYTIQYDTYTVAQQEWQQSYDTTMNKYIEKKESEHEAKGNFWIGIYSLAGITAVGLAVKGGMDSGLFDFSKD